jgi:hypothetical protein
VAEDRDWWWALENTVMNLQVAKEQLLIRFSITNSMGMVKYQHAFYLNIYILVLPEEEWFAERERKKDRGSVCVCVCVRARVRACMSLITCKELSDLREILC